MDERLKCKPRFYKTLRGKPRQNTHCLTQVAAVFFSFSKMVFDPPPGVMKIKRKTNRWPLIKVKSFHTAKRNQKQKDNSQNQRKYLQTKQTTVQLSPKYINSSCTSVSNKQSHKKIGRVYKQTFLQRRHTDDQKAYEKMLNITKYQKNANEKYNEVSPHTSQNGHHPQICKQ